MTMTMMMTNLCASKQAGGETMKSAVSKESLYPPASDKEQPVIRITTITGDRAPPTTPCATKSNHGYVNVPAMPPPTAKKPHVNVATTGPRTRAATDNYVTYQNL